MLTVIPTSPPGVTSGVAALINLIKGHPEELVELFQVEKRRIGSESTIEYTFIALFLERGTIGQFVAFINEWGTNFGPEAGGTGSAGYRKMQSFIEDHEIHSYQIQWGSIPRNLRNRLSSETSRYTHYRAWEEILIDELSYVMRRYLDATEYPINENWRKRE